MARVLSFTGFAFFLGLSVLFFLLHRVMAEWSAIAERKVSYTDDVTNFSAAAA